MTYTTIQERFAAPRVIHLSRPTIYTAILPDFGKPRWPTYQWIFDPSSQTVFRYQTSYGNDLYLAEEVVDPSTALAVRPRPIEHTTGHREVSNSDFLQMTSSQPAGSSISRRFLQKESTYLERHGKKLVRGNKI